MVDGVLTSQVISISSQLIKKFFFFDFETNPVRVDKSGLHRKKSTFRLFSLAAYDSPLKKNPKKSKNARGYMSKKKNPYETFIGYNFKLSNSEVSEPRYIIETSVENIIRLANCDPNYSERGLNVFK